MPRDFVLVDSRTVRAPDGREHDVLAAIGALDWTPQLCPLMRHEYTIWGKGGPEWAWNVLTTMLLASNPASFRAYYRNYQTANRYWDAPDGRRYWRGKYEIDRGKPDGVGQRRVSEGGKPSKAWDGPLFAPAGIGLYDRDENGRWWPTYDALASGYLPCASCAQTSKRGAIVASPKAPQRVAAFIGAAASERGRPLTRDELAEVLQQLPFDADAASYQDTDGPVELAPSRVDSSVPGVAEEVGMGNVPKAEVVRELLELRAREAPLGFSGYRGALTQKAIAHVAGVRVQDVTKAAIEMERLERDAD